MELQRSNKKIAFNLGNIGFACFWFNAWFWHCM